VRGPAKAGDVDGEQAAFGIAHLEVAFLSDQAIIGSRQSPGVDLVDQELGAELAARLLVTDDVHLELAVQGRAFEQIQHVEHDRDRALHVGSAASEQFAAIGRDSRRIWIAPP
jgi:hypothetical protein